MVQEVLLVTGSFDRDIRFWEAWSGICSRTISRSGDSGQVNRLAISPDKRSLADAIQRKINIYDISDQSQQPVTVLDGHTMNVTAVCFHSEGKWLVSGSEDGSIRIWDLRTTSLHRKYDNVQPVNDLCVHPNMGELISCDQSGRVRQWDLSNAGFGAVTDVLPSSESPMRSVSISSDGACLVAGTVRGSVSVWTAENDKYRLSRFGNHKSFQAHDGYLTKVLISPDTRLLATCSSDSTVRIWSFGKSYELSLEKVLVGHQRWVWDAAFSADSAYLVTASSDHVARLWEMSTGETVRQYNGHHRAAVCCALHDGAA